MIVVWRDRVLIGLSPIKWMKDNPDFQTYLRLIGFTRILLDCIKHILEMSSVALTIHQDQFQNWPGSK